MNRITLTLVILLGPVLALAQDNYGFPYGKITFAEMDAKSYAADTSAEAYVIKEVAEAHVDEHTGYLVFTYHMKIKILKQEGSDQADIVVPLRKSSSTDDKEVLRSVQASSFNLANNRIEETKMDSRVFTEKNGKKRYDEAKFAIPNVRAGSIIEYQYEIVSPFLYNFRRWEFQSDIPKAYSEYWTVIPGHYAYNITLRGYLEITERKDEVIEQCITSAGGNVAGCASTRYIMKNIPAFKEEEYMTAKENYLSAINFELSEMRRWDGTIDKFTKEWKDADQELRTDERFGQQLRKARNAFGGLLDASILSEADQMKKAQKVYDFVKNHFTWNEYFGAYTDVGIKKAVDDKTGNVADINLALIAALREADLYAEPVMLATRHVERPGELHPVLNDFNYVVAKMNVGDKYYLLDAVDDFLPFGLISDFCYNGKGRVIAEGGSYWIELKPADRSRIVTQVTLKLSTEGMLTGNVTHSYYGYAAVDQRKKIVSFTDEKSYVADAKSNNHIMEITAYDRTVEADLSKPITETFAVEINAFDSPGASHFLFNPFFNGRMETNPFKTEKRNFPVDFGVPVERNLIVTVEYPDNVEVTSVPDKIGLALPNAGGRYIYSALADGKKLTISNLMSIAKPIYQPEEYPYLRELYAKKIQTENTDIIFQKKK